MLARIDRLPLGVAPESTALAEDAAAKLEALYAAHARYLWRQARALGVSEAAVEDVLQEVFVVVHRRLGEFDGRANPRAWLVAILLRVAANHRRKQRRREHEPFDESAHATDPHDAQARREAARTAESVLEELDEDQRTVFVLAEIGGLTAVEIAEIVGASSNTVSSRLRLARAHFERRIARLHGRST